MFVQWFLLYFVKIKKIMAKYDAESMEAARYCYDTPGVVNNEQVWPVWYSSVVIVNRYDFAGVFSIPY